MIIEIEKVNEDTYKADIKNLPGTPFVGIGKTPEDAVALVFIENIQNLRKHAEVNDPMFYSLVIEREGWQSGNAAVC